jgi:uncharacterized protein with HEPN domain
VSTADGQRLADFLGHMLEAIDKIRRFTLGMDLAAYLADVKTQDAVIRNLEVLGEASRKVLRGHPEFAAAHSEIPWTSAYEMRNALAHGYFKVDQHVVWRTITSDLPAMALAIQNILPPPADAPSGRTPPPSP